MRVTVFFGFFLILLTTTSIQLANAGPLHEAAASGDIASVESALSDGVDPDEHGPNGKTPLIIAAENGFSEIIALLASHGADPGIFMQAAYANQAAAIHFAVKNGHLDAIAALAEAGADLTLSSYDHGAPLHMATVKDQQDVVDLIVSLGGATYQAAPVNHLIAEADTDFGRRVAVICAKCHALNAEEEPSGAGFARVGPPLMDIVGRGVAEYPGYDYTAPMKALSGAWGYDELNNLIANPTAFVPGTDMWIEGLHKAETRAALIAYLRTITENPPPLP